MNYHDPQRAEHYNIQVVNSLIQWTSTNMNSWYEWYPISHYRQLWHKTKALYKFSRLEIHFSLVLLCTVTMV